MTSNMRRITLDLQDVQKCNVSIQSNTFPLRLARSTRARHDLITYRVVCVFSPRASTFVNARMNILRTVLNIWPVACYLQNL